MNVKRLQVQDEQSPYTVCVNWACISTSNASSVCTAWCLV